MPEKHRHIYFAGKKIWIVVLALISAQPAILSAAQPGKGRRSEFVLVYQADHPQKHRYNTLLSGTVTESGTGFYGGLPPLILRVFKKDELIQDSIMVQDGMFSVDLRGKASSKDRLTLVLVSARKGFAFEHKKIRTKLRKAQNTEIEIVITSGHNQINYIYHI